MRYEKSLESERITLFLAKLARELRSRGVMVSTSELVDAAIVIENYMAVRGMSFSELLEHRDELFFILSSLLAKREQDRVILEEALKERDPGSEKKRVRDMIAAIIHDLEKTRLGYGSRVTAKKRRRLLSGGEEAESYARLKLLGVIRRARSGERVLTRSEVVEFLRRLARSGQSLDDVLKRRLTLAAERGDEIVLTLFRDAQRLGIFEEVSLDAMVRLAEAALRRGAREEAAVLASIVAKRIRSGESVDALRAYSVLKRLGVLDDSILLVLASHDKSVASMLARESWDVFDRLLYNAGHEKAARLIAGLAHDPRLRERAAKLLDEAIGDRGVLFAEYFLSHSPRVKDGVFSVLSLLSSARESLLAGLVSGDEAYTDYALYQLSLAERRLEDIRKYRSLYSAVHTLIESYRGLIVDSVLGEGLTRRVLVGGIVDAVAVEDLLRLAQSSRHNVRAAARRLLYIVLSRTRRLLRGRGRVVRRREVSAGVGGSRVDVYRLARAFLLWDFSSVRYLRKVQRGRVVLVLDKSGSMRPYAVSAVLAASAFTGVVDKLVLFDTRVTVYSGKITRRPYQLLNIILSTSFEGYTDVISALRHVARLDTSSRVLILISDLRQTVILDDSPATLLGEVFRDLYSRGWRIFVLSPPSIDNKIRSLVSKYARVYVIDEPSSVEKVLVRILSHL